jgi:hypothetical protein
MNAYAHEVTTDEDVKRFCDVVFHPDICKNLIKDHDSVKNNISVIKNDDYYCTILVNNEEDIGIVAFKIYKDIKKSCADVGVIKEFRGKNAYLAVKDGLIKFFKKYPEIELYSFVKKANRASLFFAMKMGFKIQHKVYGHYFLRYKNV